MANRLPLKLLYSAFQHISTFCLFHVLSCVDSPKKPFITTTMPASKHLLVVNSRPTVVSPSLWQKWYALEHLPDLVNSKTSTRAALYQEIAFLLNPNPTHPRTFLAVYQTEFEEPLKSQEYGNARSTSELFKREGGSDKIPDNGDFDARNYTLIQEFDPKGTGERALFFCSSCSL